MIQKNHQSDKDGKMGLTHSGLATGTDGSISWIQGPGRRLLLSLLVALVMAVPSISSAIGGAQLWSVEAPEDAQTPEPTSQEALKAVVDSAGCMIVTGFSNESGHRDFYTVKFRADGTGVLWEKRHDRLGGEDSAMAVAVDADNNVVVSGYVWNGLSRKYDVHTIKYHGTNGQVLWQHTYDRGAGGDDWATSVTTDSLRNVYVAGYSQNGVSGKDDYLVIKYGPGGPNPDGTPVWASTWDGPAGGHDRALAITAGIDGVAVTGESQNLVPDFDLVTVKFNLSGSFLWAATEKGPSGDDRGTALRMDGAGNVYATGYLFDGTDRNIFTARYAAASGNLTWSKTYAGPYTDESTDLLLDDEGHVFVAGYTFQMTTANDFWAAKYHPQTDTTIWTATYASASGNADEAKAGVLAASGDLFLAGITYDEGSSNYDIRTVKLSGSNGHLLWASAYNNAAANKNDRAVGLGLTPDGKPIVAGWTERAASGDSDLIAIQYDPGLLNRPTNLTATALSNIEVLLAWTDQSANEEGFRIERKIGEFGTYAEITVSCGSVAPNTTSYHDTTVVPDTKFFYRVKACSSLTGDSEFSDEATAKTTLVTMSPPIWAYTYDGGVNADDYLTAIGIGPDNHPVATGYSYSVGGQFDYYTIKLGRQSGGLIWNQRHDSDQNDLDIAVSVVVDSSNDVLVSGYSYMYSPGAGQNTNDIYTIKYPSAGPPAPVMWADQYNGPAGDDDRSSVVTVARDGSENYIVAGYGRNAAWDDDIYLVKYLHDGPRAWDAVPYNHVAGGNDYPVAVAVSTAGDIFLAGYVSNGSNYDLFVAKYNGNTGAIIWTDTHNGPGNGDDKAKGIAIDNAGNLYVTGSRYNLSGNKDFYTIKYDGAASTPVRLWERAFDGPAGGDDEAADLKIDPIGGDIIVSGTTSDSGGNKDYHVRRYASDGSLVWEKTLDMPGTQETVVAMGIDLSGNVCVAGDTFNGTDRDALSMKFNHNGDVIGATLYTGVAGGWDEATAVTQNQYGETFVGGYTTTMTGDTDYLVFRCAWDPMQVATSFVGTPRYTDVALTWVDNSMIEEGFRIERKLGACNAAGTWTLVTTTSPNTATFTNQNLSLGTQYCYRIQAFNDTTGEASRWIETAATTLVPLAPSGLTAVATSTTTIGLTWTDNTVDEDAFVIERCAGAGCDFSSVQELVTGANVTAYSDTTVCAGQTYSYRVKARRTGQWATLPTPSAPANTDITTPTAGEPTGLAAVLLNEQEVELTWIDNSVDETGFRLYRCAGVSCTNFTQIASLPYSSHGSFQSGIDVSFWNPSVQLETVSDSVSPIQATDPDTGSQASITTATGVELYTTSTDTSASSTNYTGYNFSNLIFKNPGAFGRGDFDIQADYNLLSGLPSSSLYNVPVRFQVGFSNGDSAYVERYSNAGANYYQGVATIGGLQTLLSIPTTDTTGKLRIVRSAGSISLYAWTGGQWTLVLTHANKVTTTATLSQLYITQYANRENAIALRTRIDNFVISSMHPRCNEISTFMVNPLNPSCVDADQIQPNVTYRYQVAAYKTAGLSSCNWTLTSLPAETVTTPVPPSALSATALSSTEVRLAWQDNTVTETGFRIERCTGTGCDFSTATAFTVAANVTTYTDTTACFGITYRYRVRAEKSTATSWNSAWNALPVEATTTTPSAPPSVSVVQMSESDLKVSWADMNLDESGYTAERCSGGGCSNFQTLFTFGGGCGSGSGNVLLLHMEESSWGSVADSSGAGNNGTAANGAAPVAGGKFGQAGNFDGSDDCVTTPVVLNQSSSSPGATMEAWVYPASVSSDWRYVISTDNGDYDWTIARNGSTWYVATGSTLRSTGFTVDANQWQHIAAVFIPGTGVKFYKNGVEGALIPYIEYDTSTGAVNIGRASGGYYYFDGRIDEVAVYDRALTSTQVLAHYSSTRGIVCPTQFTDKGLDPSTSYSYRIQTTKSATCSWTVTSPVGTGTTASLPTATLSSAATDTTHVALSWNDPTTGETQYRLQRCQGAACDFSTPTETVLVADTVSYSDSTACAGTAYRYRIRAEKPGYGGWPTPWSNITDVSTPSPTAASGLVTTSVSESEIRLSWPYRKTDEEGVRILRCTGSGTSCDEDTEFAQIDQITVANYDTQLELVMYMDESAWSGAANAVNDLSGKGHHGTAYGGVTTTTSGKYGSAGNFDGVDDYVATSFKIDQSSTTPGVTMEAWVYPLTIAGIRHVISTDDGGYDWGIFQYNNIWYVNSGTTQYSTGFTVDANQWQHLAVVYKPGVGTTFYKNGVPWTTTSIDYDTSTANLTIGRRAGSAYYYFSGRIDDAAVFNRPLTAADITDHYTSRVRIRYLSSSLVPSTTYTYRLRSYKSSACGEWTTTSASASGTTMSPPAPSSLVATAVNTTNIRLTWTDNTGAETAFRVERCTGAAGACLSDANFTWNTTVGANTNTYTDSSVCAGGTYTYRVRAEKSDPGAWTTLWSSTATVTATAVQTTTLTGQLVSETQVDLTWTDASDEESGFELQRCVQSGPVTCTQDADFTVIRSTPEIMSGNLIYYQMDEASWTGAAGEVKDRSKYGNHGTAYGGVNTTAQGHPNRAGNFDGTDDYVGTSVTLDETLSGPGATFEAWVYPTNAGAWYTQVVSTDNGWSDWAIVQYYGTWYAYVGKSQRSTGFAVDLNQWQHVAAVFIPGTGVKFYKNGTEALIPFMDYDTSSGAVNIGRRPGGGNLFAGRIDEVAVFNRQLSASEIQYHYVNGLTLGQYSDTSVSAGQTLHYRMRMFKNATCGWQTYSNTVPIALTPPGPNGLTATAVGSNRILLSWTDNTSTETLFRIQRCEGAGCSSFADLTTLAANTRTYTDASACASVTYRYRVRAENSGASPWVSAWSGEAQAQTLASGDPTGLVAAAVSDTDVELSWTDSAFDATGFRVERCTGSGCSNFSEIATAGVRYGSTLLLHMDEASWGQVTDSSGSGNHGTAYNGASTVLGGQKGLAGSFNGVNQYIEIPHNAGLNPADKLTIEIWAKSSTASWNASGTLMSKRDAYLLYPVSGSKEVRFYIHDGTWLPVSFTPTFDITQWHHYAASYDGQTMKLYLDGVLVASRTYGGNVDADTGPLYIGRDDGTTAYFSGLLDEAAVYSRALSDAEIQARYAGSSGAYYRDTSGAANTSYCYRVRAYQTAACGWTSAYSNSTCDMTLPGSSMVLTASALNSMSVQLTWPTTPAGEEGYELEREIWGGRYVTIATLPVGQTSYTDNQGLEPTKTYRYRVRSYRGTDKSSYSNPASVVLPAWQSGDGPCPP